MNRKQFIVLLILVAVVGTAGLLVWQRGQSSWHDESTAIGQKLLPNLAVNDVTQVTIKSGTDQLNLARRDNLWRVHERNDYPANFPQISDLLIKLADLKVVQSEDIGPSQLGRFELLPPGGTTNGGTQVELKDQAGKTLASVLLGKKHMKKGAGNPSFGGMGDEGWPDGRYVLTGMDSTKLKVISDSLDKAEAKPDQWLDKDFLNIEKPNAIAVTYPEATNSWKLTRLSETNAWQLADAKADEKLDASKISSVTAPFSSASFNDVSPLAEAGTNPVAVVTVETFDGFKYVAKVGPKANENYPVTFAITALAAADRSPAKDEKPADKARLDQAFQNDQGKLSEKLARESAYTKWVYQIPAYMMDSLLKKKSELLVEAKKDEPAKAEK